MSYPINYPTPQGANVQIFNGGGTNNKFTVKDWVKPQGASFVWFTLIGSGGSGATAGATGGGSGAVTNCMVPAFLIPDTLRVLAGVGGVSGGDGQNTTVVYQAKDGTGYTLLTANAGGGGDATAAGGAASTSNFFSCMGFFQSIAGQSGATGTTASTTTFLSGGASNRGYPVANYGYGGNGATGTSQTRGYFQMQPIIVGVGGGLDNTGNIGFNGGIGCGGGGSSSAAPSGNGGDGLVVIITW